jgi:hypothetical protein
MGSGNQHETRLNGTAGLHAELDPQRFDIGVVATARPIDERSMLELARSACSITRSPSDLAASR